MLKEQELAFIEYWEQNRDKESRFMAKFIAGLPMAMIFGLPILLLVVVVYFFFPTWYSKVGSEFSNSLPAIVVAVFIAIVFFAFARKHFEWEQKENQYLALKARQKKN